MRRYSPRSHAALRLLRRGEHIAICKEALAREGPLDTRELALRVIRAKGLDETDRALRAATAYQIVQAMRLQAKRGQVESSEKRNGVRLWKSRNS
jgi:hypothetical protein